MSIDVFGRSKIRPKDGRKGETGVGFKLTKDRHYDMLHKRITNLSSGVNPFDAINKQYVDTIVLYIDSLKARLDSIESKSTETHNYVSKFDRWVLAHDTAINFMEAEGTALKFQKSIETIDGIANDLSTFKNMFDGSLTILTDKVQAIENELAKRGEISVIKNKNVQKGNSKRNS